MTSTYNRVSQNFLMCIKGVPGVMLKGDLRPLKAHIQTPQSIF